MPVYKAEIQYKRPIMIGQEIIIKSSFITNKGPRIKVYSRFFSLKDELHAEAFIDIVLINKKTFKVVRKRPEFIESYFNNLSKY